MNFGYIKSKLTGKESKFTTESKVPSDFKNSIPTSEGADFIIQNSWDSSWEESEYPTIPYKDFNKFYEL